MSEVRIIAPYYSGEYTMGTVTTEFVEYWSNREEDELLEYLHEVNWAEEFQSTSPTETGTELRTPFHDIDDIEHFNMPYIEPYMGDRFVYVNHEEEEIEFKPYMCQCGTETMSLTIDQAIVISKKHISQYSCMHRQKKVTAATGQWM